MVGSVCQDGLTEPPVKLFRKEGVPDAVRFIQGGGWLVDGRILQPLVGARVEGQLGNNSLEGQDMSTPAFNTPTRRDIVNYLIHGEIFLIPSLLLVVKEYTQTKQSNEGMPPGRNRNM